MLKQKRKNYIYCLVGNTQLGVRGTYFNFRRLKNVDNE